MGSDNLESQEQTESTRNKGELKLVIPTDSKIQNLFERESDQLNSSTFQTPKCPSTLQHLNQNIVSSTDNLSVKTKSESVYSYETKCPSFMFHKLKFLFRYVILIGLIGAICTSTILLLLGVLFNFRACLTTGCILGIACFGVILHGCLRHRSLPNSPMPVVLSAACIYPVSSVPISSNYQGLSAAAVATAAFIPSGLQEQSSLLNSNFGSRILSRVPKAMIIYSKPCSPDGHFLNYSNIPEGNYNDTEDNGSRNLNDGTSDVAQCGAFHRQISDSVMYTKPRKNRSRNHRSTKLRFSMHSSTSPFEVSDPNNRPSRLNVTNHVINENSEIDKTNDESNQPGSGQEIDDISQEINLRSEIINTSVTSHHSSTSSNSNSENIWAKPEIISSNLSTLPRPNGTFPIHKHKLKPHSSIMRYSVLIPTKQHIKPSFSRDCLSLFTEYQSDPNHVMSNRSFNRIPRDREDIFGPRVWQGWKNWVDP